MNHTYLRISFVALATVFGFCFALSANAGVINYAGPNPGPGGMTGWSGNDVWYGGVSESNTEGTGGSDGQTANLFGAPVGVTGNAISFAPQNFEARSDTADVGATIVDGQLSFMVVANQGSVINNFLFSEAGDTTLAGLPSADFAVTSVSAPVFVNIVEIDGVSVAPISLSQSLVFTPSNGDYVLSVDGSPVTFTYNTIWNGTTSFDINQALTDAGASFVDGATKINVTLDNTLTASSEAGASAFIKKKVAGGVTIVTNVPDVVPEPTTALLLVLACLPFATAKQRS